MIRYVYIILALACISLCVPQMMKANGQQVSVLNSTNTSSTNCNTCQPASSTSAIDPNQFQQQIPQQQQQAVPTAPANVTTTSQGREITIVVPPIHVLIPGQNLTAPATKIMVVKVPVSIPASSCPQSCGVQAPTTATMTPQPQPQQPSSTTTSTTQIIPQEQQPIVQSPQEEQQLQPQPQVINSPTQEARGPLVIHPDPFGSAGFCSDGHRGESFETSIGTPVTICPNNGASFIHTHQFQHQDGGDINNEHGNHSNHHSNNGEPY